MKRVKTWRLLVVMQAFALSLCAAGEKAGTGQQAMPAPLAHWTLNDVKDGTVADSSGNGRTGALVKMAADALVDGRNGKALKFDGKGGFVQITGTAKDQAFDFNGKKFTVALWVNYTEGHNGYIICKGRGSHPGWAVVAHAPAQLDIGGGHVQGFAFKGKTTGQWVHLAAVVDMAASPPSYKAYVNGLPVNNGTLDPAQKPSPGDPADDLVLGARGNGIEPFYKGLLDDVYLFDQGLTDDQIKVLYNSSSAPPAKTPQK